MLSNGFRTDNKTSDVSHVRNNSFEMLVACWLLAVGRRMWNRSFEKLILDKGAAHFHRKPPLSGTFFCISFTIYFHHRFTPVLISFLFLSFLLFYIFFFFFFLFSSDSALSFFFITICSLSLNLSGWI